MVYNYNGTLHSKAVWWDHDDNPGTADIKDWIYYSYDGYGKLIAVDYPDNPGYNDVVYQYESDATERVQQITDYRGTETDYEFVYGPTGEILQYIVTPAGEPAYKIDYTYHYVDTQKKDITVTWDIGDDPNNTNSVIYQVGYDFDAAGRLIGVNDMLHDTIEQHADNFDRIAYLNYTPNGNKSALYYSLDGTDIYDTDGNMGAPAYDPWATPYMGVEYSYNADNVLQQYDSYSGSVKAGYDVEDNFITEWTTVDEDFEFDASLNGDIDGRGRLVSGSETVSLSQTHNLSYSYDLMGQLTGTSVTNIGGSPWTSGYDYYKDGNIYNKTENSVDTAYQFDGDLMDYAGLTDLVWDNNGRLTAGTSFAFEYNTDGTLKTATGGGTTVQIRYDPMGNRIRKQTNDPNAQGNRIKILIFLVLRAVFLFHGVLSV